MRLYFLLKKCFSSFFNNLLPLFCMWKIEFQCINSLFPKSDGVVTDIKGMKDCTRGIKGIT